MYHSIVDGHLKKLALVLAVVVLAVVVACGGGDAEPTSAPVAQQATATSAPAPTAAPAATIVPTPTVKAAPTAIQATVAAPSASPSGKLTLALPSVGSPIFVNSLAPYPRGIFRADWGMCESLATVDVDDGTKVVAQLAESWVIAPDQSKMTFKIRKGVQFHKGNGEMKAQDVVFSYNNAGADNPESTAAVVQPS